ncbi:MAG: S8 family serine peptidase [Flavobacteriales bacterium]|nr:S8 family serine peptidase [Flavobacteriales bacterium]
MSVRSLILALLFLVGGAASAQGPSKMGFQLRAWLATAKPPARVDLFLGGDAAEVSRAVLMHGGMVKMAVAGWVEASMPVDRVKALEKEPAIRSIVFTLSKGRMLNDSMRVKAHVNEVHDGLPPLPMAYQGEGVLVGIIDSGLELGHPDFQDSLGRTRVLRYWDQNFDYDPGLTPVGFGYGQAWDSTAINAGDCPAVDPFNQYGHGSTVAATAAANNNGNGHCAGVAPKADLIIVANDMGYPNWTASVVDVVRYIVEQATAMGRPVAINLSLGDYFGSHDGLDPAALMIDQLLTAEPGRVLVCAAGNSGNLPPYHLRTEVTADTTFTWFAYNPNSVLNVGAVYFDLWADTADFSQVQYSIGADKFNGGYSFRGRIPFRNIQGTLNQIVVDTLWSVDGNKLGRVFTQAQLRDGQYHMEVYIPQPDSAAQLYYRFITTGSGRFDVWSTEVFGTSKMITAIPDSTSYPAITRYVAPDKEQSMVDSWACSPQVITVGNFYNQQQYVDITGTTRDLGNVPGSISVNSSRGPSRTGVVKPDVAAPADVTFGAGPLDVLQALLNFGPEKLIDSLHMRNGGTSIASPVVAGTAALLLEKCPRATNAMVRDAIIGSASSDSLTGSVPNTRFGYGKINAFAALVSTNVAVPLTLMDVLCEGDSTMVSGPDFMYRYWWNTGQQQRDIWTTGDTLQLTVETTHGCMGISDTLIVVPNPLPTGTISVDGLTLESSPAAAYQWYVDSLPIPGAEDQQYDVEENGHYFVQLTDSLGCSANSDTVFIFSVGIPEPVPANLQLWPVPVMERLNLRGLDAAYGDLVYDITDVSGRSVQYGILRGRSPVIYVAELSSGMYLLNLRGMPSGTGLRFIKE